MPQGDDVRSAAPHRPELSVLGAAASAWKAVRARRRALKGLPAAQGMAGARHQASSSAHEAAPLPTHASLAHAAVQQGKCMAACNYC